MARRPGRLLAVGTPIADAPHDVLVTATFRNAGGARAGGYGLIVGDRRLGAAGEIGQTDRLYVFGVSDRDELGLWRWEGDRWTDLLPRSRSEAVRHGRVANDLMVWAIGGRLTFLFNGVQAVSLEDRALLADGMKVFTGGNLGEVVLERVAVSCV